MVLFIIIVLSIMKKLVFFAVLPLLIVSCGKANQSDSPVSSNWRGDLYPMAEDADRHRIAACEFDDLPDILFLHDVL